MIKKQAIFLLLAFLSAGCAAAKHTPSAATLLNDVHSRLNPTRVQEVLLPDSTEELVKIVQRAKKEGKAISISGGRHAMGGQQFGTGTIHIAMTKMNDVMTFDKKKGIVRVEAGILWPRLVQFLLESQEGVWPQWGIVQKQTGADNLSIGGALSANIHGRGVRLKPIIQDVEGFTLVNAEGEVLEVSRTSHPELFKLVIGGYGLFGIIATVDLRLAPRVKLERVVEVLSSDDLPKKVQERLQAGFLYGDFQYKTDEGAADFMKSGIFSTYRPLPDDAAMPETKKLTPENWHQYLLLAHTDKSKAFEFYSRYYLSTNGNHYWSDTHQMGYYDDQYLEYLKQALPKEVPDSSLMITELYVPRARLLEFIERIREESAKQPFDIIYGTMRLIERDDESFLAWAKENYACIIFNLRVEHSEKGIAAAQERFRRLIDLALDLGGSYYLTYHRWARRDQLLRAYPQFPEFLRLKLQYDPEERFQSDWYRHYKQMFQPGNENEN